MEITIKGTEKEITGLVREMQNRQSMVIHENRTPSSLTAKSTYEACRKHFGNPLYLCDPQKNTECSKTGCQNSCFMTANKAYAKIDDDGTETRYYYPQLDKIENTELLDG